MPKEISPKVFRLANWARSQKDAGTVRMSQLMEHSTKVGKAGRQETVRADLENLREEFGTARSAG